MAKPLLENKKFLVIVPEVEMNRIITTIIKNAGGIPYVCESTIDAKKILADHYPDIILTDLSLNLESVKEFILYCQKEKWTKKIPNIILGNAHKEDLIIELIGLGAYTYIIKPIRSWDLINTIKKIFFKKKDESSFKKLATPIPLEVGINCIMSRLSGQGVILEGHFKATKIGGMSKVIAPLFSDVRKKEMVCEIDDISMMAAKGEGNYITKLKFHGLSEDQVDLLHRKIKGWQ